MIDSHDDVIYINKNTFDVLFYIKNINNSEDYFDCDILIADTIRILNLKGYVTEFCCSGHVPKNGYGICSTYIAFREDINLPFKPYGFEYIKDINTIRLPSIIKNIKYRYIKYVNNILHNWALELPPYNSQEVDWVRIAAIEGISLIKKEENE